MKVHLLWALIALLCMAAIGLAEDAPPPCVGDQCGPAYCEKCKPDPAPAVEQSAPKVEGPQKSVVKSRKVALPRVREVEPARKLVGATCKIARYGLKGGRKLMLVPFRRAQQAADGVRSRVSDRVQARRCRRGC